MKLKTFVIHAKATVDTDTEVRAKSLEDAVVQARDLTVHDFVEILGSHNDSELTITGVFSHD